MGGGENAPAGSVSLRAQARRIASNSAGVAKGADKVTEGGADAIEDADDAVGANKGSGKTGKGDAIEDPDPSADGS